MAFYTKTKTEYLNFICGVNGYTLRHVEYCGLDYLCFFIKN